MMMRAVIGKSLSRARQEARHYRLFEILAMAVVGVFVLVAILGESIVPYDPNKINALNSFAAPSGDHPFGTDELGRDMLSRLVVGTRVVLQVTFGAVTLALVGGTIIGIAAGLIGGFVESVVMRITDILFAFPTLLLGIIVVAVAGPGVLNAAIALGLVYLPRFVRTARAATVSLKSRAFIDASYLSGRSSFYVGARHIAPNLGSEVIVLTGLCISNLVIAYTSLSFLGLGVKPPEADWGSMLATAKNYLMVDPWLAVFPGVAMVVFILSCNIVSDALANRLNVSASSVASPTASTSAATS